MKGKKSSETLYKINEIFYSVQLEGFNTGRPAVFLRFSGCNLRCVFCDTLHDSFVEELTKQQIIAALDRFPSTFLVVTGGEPMLHLDEDLLRSLSAIYDIALETNGTIVIPDKFRQYINWITVSPKRNSLLQQKKGNEVKVVFPDCMTNELYQGDGFDFDYHYVTPCDDEHKCKNTQQTITFCKNNPKWRLSIQTHKYIGVR